jgi:putative FmdB family regulatory protein
MATYEYRCKECEKLFTVTEAISRHEAHRSNPKCPQCGSRKTARLWSGFFAKTTSKS